MADEKKLCEIQKHAKFGLAGFAGFLLLLLLVFAGLIGDDYACRYKKYEAPVPTMVHFPQIRSDYTGAISLSGTGSSSMQSYMKTIFSSKGNGKEMQAGFFKLEGGKKLEYTQWYEGFIFILSGQFSIKDTRTTQTGLPGDSFYLPRGTTVTYSSSIDSVLYYVNQPPGFEFAQQIQAATSQRPAIRKKTNHKNIELPLFKNEEESLSYLKDTIFSKLAGRELTGGFYRLKEGPALNYIYGYEEFKYIVEGEFHLKDGTGKKVVAKAGDLMYFPKGVAVEFTSPSEALGFFVGQRKPDEA